MQLEPYPDRDGYRVWMSEQEQQKLLNFYEEDAEKQLAIELMLDGLRADEVPRVSMEDFRRMKTEEEGWMLHVWESKTDYRECPVSNSTKQKAKMLKNVKGLRKDEPIVESVKRTVQRWVTRAAESIAEEDDTDDNWKHVTAHDCRRSWCTHTYWRLEGSRAREVVMAWGGWSDVQTFTTQYLGKIPDSVAIEVMDEAQLR